MTLRGLQHLVSDSMVIATHSWMVSPMKQLCNRTSKDTVFKPTEASFD